MLGAFGMGGPSVGTVLNDPTGMPGAPLTGRVELVGGSHDAGIEHITLSLVIRMEIEPVNSLLRAHCPRARRPPGR
jgi:sporulation-control protein